MREDPWSFKVTHHLVLATNHLPKIEDPSEGMGRRLRVVPFGVKFIDPDTMPGEQRHDPKVAKQNKNLLAELQQELPGILRWLVKGCIAWQERGLSLPEEVLVATGDYRRESDNK